MRTQNRGPKTLTKVRACGLDALCVSGADVVRVRLLVIRQQHTSCRQAALMCDSVNCPPQTPAGYALAGVLSIVDPLSAPNPETWVSIPSRAFPLLVELGSVSYLHPFTSALSPAPPVLRAATKLGT